MRSGFLTRLQPIGNRRKGKGSRVVNLYFIPVLGAEIVPDYLIRDGSPTGNLGRINWAALTDIEYSPSDFHSFRLVSRHLVSMVVREA